MGVYSTVCLSREVAIKILMENIQYATDEELSDALFGLLHQRSLYNYSIETNGASDDNYLYDYRVLYGEDDVT